MIVNACGIATLSFNLFWVVMLSVDMVKHDVNFCDTLVDVVSCTLVQAVYCFMVHPGNGMLWIMNIHCIITVSGN